MAIDGCPCAGYLTIRPESCNSFVYYLTEGICNERRLPSVGPFFHDALYPELRLRQPRSQSQRTCRKAGPRPRWSKARRPRAITEAKCAKKSTRLSIKTTSETRKSKRPPAQPRPSNRAAIKKVRSHHPGPFLFLIFLSLAPLPSTLTPRAALILLRQRPRLSFRPSQLPCP